MENPTHTFGLANPNDTVTLVVKNACGCSDTFRVVLNISKITGPVISCASIVCDSQTATYSIPDDGCAGTYDWSVIGGTIISGVGTATITVTWNAVGPDGYGYVSVDDPCAKCTDTSTIKIPVILANATIKGPDTICVNQQYEYTLPLWAATQYMWGVLENPDAIVVYRDDYKVIVSFTTPGTYTLHGWYQNTLALCGGNEFKTITVLPPAPIVGNTSICQFETDSFTVGGLSANWTLIDDITGTVINTTSGATYNNTFSTPGVYLLSAIGAFCADPLTITVLQSPPPVDSITGPDTICLGRVYTYTAASNVPGTIFNWQAIGGTVSPASGSATVNVIWTAGGSGMQLLANRISTTSPYCAGLPTPISIMQEIINPDIIGDLAPCANSHRSYTTSYTRGEVYDWSIYPNTAGSVVSGDHTTGINVLWNNVTGTSALSAALIVTVHKCDSIVSDTVNVLIQPSSGVTLTVAPDPGCPGTPLTLTAAVGGSSYAWDFGDGSGLVTTTTNTTTHSFPDNTTTDNVTYIVEVTVIPDSTSYCPISGMASYVESILPGPVAYASTGSHTLCDGSSTTLVGTATDNVGALTYQWYDGTAISGATGSTYSTNTIGTYSFQVTAGNGCSSMSNGILIYINCPDTGGLACPTITAATSSTCNVITLTGITTGGTSPNWQAITPTSNGSTYFAGMTATASYSEPGIYDFFFYETFGACTAHTYATDTIWMVPDFVYEVHCADSTMDSILLQDHTAYLPGCTISNFVWTEATLGLLGSGTPNLHTAFAAPGIYVVTETVSGTNPHGIAFSCSVTDTINVPSKPSGVNAQFTFAVSPICSTVPISFTPSFPTGIVGYNWSFGDGASSLLQSPQREYTYGGPDPFIKDTVTLTVTDSLGCTADTIGIVQIQTNVFDGNLGPSPILVCSNDAPVTLAFNNISIFTVSSYLWSTTETTSSILVNTSGAYWVTVTGSFQCQKTFTFPATEVEIINVPTVSISGSQVYCEGDVVKLSGYAGAGLSYQWYMNGTPDGTNPYVNDAGLMPGDYGYQLVLSVIDSVTGAVLCTDTATDTVHILKLPPVPVITGPVAIDCDHYHLQLTATESSPGFYNWSDGNTGAIDDIYSGGAYEVWFTDLNGCVSNASTLVAPSVDFYMQYFPTGCYTLCKQQLPLTLYGPPDELFSNWQWLRDGGLMESGTGLMAPYTITNGGDYMWTLDNGLCHAKSGIMDVNIISCDKCGKDNITAKLTCTPDNPASYEISITLFSPAAGTTYTLGTNMGPIDPFSGTLPTAGAYVLDLTYTTLSLPPLSSIVVEVLYTLPDGSKCFQKVKVTVPYACDWVAERSSGSDTATTAINPISIMGNALLVFPNPASGEMTISYEYGLDGHNERSLSIYDEMGRKIQNTTPQDTHGNWNLNTTDWTPGVYIIRMDGDGKSLQTQRVVISH